MIEGVRFVWDEPKAIANLGKHGVSFELARRAFADPFAILEQDRVEEGEMRWQTIGMAYGVKLLVVAHTIRDNADVEIIRIISARHAEKHERRRYENEARPV
jgi:uncharacterized protein